MGRESYRFPFRSITTLIFFKYFCWILPSVFLRFKKFIIWRTRLHWNYESIKIYYCYKFFVETVIFIPFFVSLNGKYNYFFLFDDFLYFKNLVCVSSSVFWLSIIWLIFFCLKAFPSSRSELIRSPMTTQSAFYKVICVQHFF